MKNIVNEDFKLQIIPIAIPPDGVIVQSDITDPGVTVIKGLKLLLNNKYVLIDKIIGNWTAVNLCPVRSSAYTFQNGAVTITATSTKVFSNYLNVLLEEDQGNCIGLFLDPGSNPFPCNCTIKVNPAGQLNCKGA